MACWGETSGGIGASVGDEKTHPGEVCPGGPFIAICLHVAVRDVADVDIALVHRAPHPARRIATEVEVAVMTVVVVAVVVMAVVVMAMVVMAVMAMTAATMAGRRIARGGEGRNGQRNSGDSGSEERTVHETTPGLIQSDHRPGVCPVSALRSPKVM